MRYPTTITSVSTHQEKRAVVKHKTIITSSRHRKTDYARLQTKVLEKPWVGYVSKHPRLQTNVVQHKKQLHPTDGHIGDGLVAIFWVLGVAAVIVFIAGLIAGSVPVAIIGGIFTAIFVATCIAVSASQRL